MTNSTEAETVKMHLAHLTYDDIIFQLGVRRSRVSRTLRAFHQSGIILEALRIGRPQKRRSELVDLIEARTLRELSISAMDLSREIEETFGVTVSCTTVNTTRKGLRFKYCPPRHHQMLTPRHGPERIAFCEKMLSIREVLPRIHFSDESLVVLGDDKGGIWYWAGEDNPESLMVSAVIGVGFKSNLLVVQGTIDAYQCLQNIDRLGFIDSLDQKLKIDDIMW
jgi:transposase